MVRKQQRLVYIGLIFGIFALILNYVADSSFGGDWGTVNAAYIGSIPYLFFMGVGLYFAVTGKIGFIGTTLLMGILGIINAGLFNYWNDQGIWIDAFVDATVTITDIMLIVCMTWLIFGFLLGAVKR